MVAIKKVPEEGILAAVLLSFMATAGLFYVNLGGAFLSAFVDGMGLSREAAGYVDSANKYGAAFGALMAAFAVGRLPWRKTIYFCFAIMIAIDFLSMQITAENFMIGMRFMHGTIGGFSVGMAFGVIARTKSPDRVFGMLLFIQYTFGSVGLFTVPRMVEALGHSAVFYALICFTTLALLMVPFVGDYKIKTSSVEGGTAADGAGVVPLYKKYAGPFMLALFAVFLFQASNMGVAVYLIELGKSVGMAASEAGDVLGVAGFISIAGGALVYFIGTRYGRVRPLMLGLVITVIGTYAFHWSDNSTIYFVANAVTGTLWGFLIPYLLGLVSSFDNVGRMAALAGFISKLGLASGPFIAAKLVGEGNFGIIINFAVVGLILCAVAAFIPARTCDKLEQG